MTPPAMPAVLMGHHADRALPAAVNSDIQGTGFAIKSPRFYELYMGPKEPQFNAVATTGVLVHRGGGPGGDTFDFTGTVAGRLTESVPTVFVFGINRGAGKSPGPFTDRGVVVFDSVVTVSIGPTGVVGAVNVSGKSTILPSQDVRVVGSSVAVAVPASLLPSTGFSPGQYQFNLWVNNPQATAEPIASFVPENRDIPVFDLRG
jgi:hypothetical protein